MKHSQRPENHPALSTTSPSTHGQTDVSHDLPIPLCVDLDGTLVKSDTLVDSTLALARQHPALLLNLPGWLSAGKAALKRHITSSVELDVVHLPYNRELLQFLEQQHAAGPPHLPRHRRRRDARPAHRRPPRPLHRRPRLRRLHQPRRLQQARCLSRALRRQLLLHRQRPPRPSAALRLHRAHGRQPHPRPQLRPPVGKDHAPPHLLRDHPHRQSLAQSHPPSPVGQKHPHLSSPPPCPRPLRQPPRRCRRRLPLLRPLRLRHLHHQRPPRHRGRPPSTPANAAAPSPPETSPPSTASPSLHSSSSPPPPSRLLVPRVIAAIAPELALAHPYKFAGWLALYTVTTLAYSLRLKRAILIDVIVLSGLYTVRILAGSAATGVSVSTWLAGFSIFFFLSLAFVKRFAELESLRARGGITSQGRGYHIDDIEQLRCFGSASAYASVVVFTLYISNLSNATELYRHTTRLWLLVPVLLLWLSRLWLLASPRPAQRRPRRLRHHRQALPRARSRRRRHRPLRAVIRVDCSRRAVPPPKPSHPPRGSSCPEESVSCRRSRPSAAVRPPADP